ncbi:MAG: hypothetical protein IPL28_22660 [Chloroflexi bacterium]|nr:hypothetical protein [Chloroflexota bacterium]
MGWPFFREDGVQVNSPNTQLGRVPTGTLHGRGTIRLRSRAHLAFAKCVSGDSGRLTAKASKTYDYHDRAYTFRVVFTTQPETHGLLSLPAKWVVR